MCVCERERVCVCMCVCVLCVLVSSLQNSVSQCLVEGTGHDTGVDCSGGEVGLHTLGPVRVEPSRAARGNS